ncbi:uncharacterized protein LOC126968447 [Leptidea sinapis]|uniref:uncharacterized protein LOC126968447 n=1 Tax=Leptidea sinapis TaxID=189913 RepID=UPI0021C3D552|nr:uncharacterized protein LOC126968447 [Leptidea sinapis]
MSTNVFSESSSIFKDKDRYGKAWSASSSSEESDSDSEVDLGELNYREQECAEWKTSGTLNKFPFTSVGQFNIGKAENPIDFFEIMFNPLFITTLVDSINTNATSVLAACNQPHSRINSWKHTTVKEIRIFIALLFHMGHIRLDKLNDYWKTDILFDLPFKNFMSRDRFLILYQNLCFTDSNTYTSDYSRFTTPVINYFNSLMKNLVAPPKNLTISEILNRKLTIRENGHRYGVKLYVLTDTYGITHKMYLYSGTHDTDLRGKGHSEKIVLFLMQDLFNMGHSLYTDKYYNSVSLAEKLLEKRTYLTGTLKNNKVRNSSIARVKLNKGTFLSWYNSRGVCITNYKNVRNVLMISTEHHATIIECTNKHGGLRKAPKVFAEYKKSMMGGDRENQILSYYPPSKKTAFKNIVIHVMQTMALNAFEMFNEQAKAFGDNGISYLDFRIEVIKNLLNINVNTLSVSNNISPHPTESRIEVSSEANIHLPECLPKNDKGKSKRKDCRNCLKKRNVRKATIFHCPLCIKKPGLCLKCFREYHNY